MANIFHAKYPEVNFLKITNQATPIPNKVNVYWDELIQSPFFWSELSNFELGS